MVQYTPSTEVDFVIIGSGAAGGIMAKQLSVAGFSVVVLEQGGWGKYGKEHEYTKDEWLNDMDPDAQLMSDPVTQPNTFRRNDKEKAGPGVHSYGCVVGGGTVTYGGSSWRHLPWEFNEVTHLGGAPSGSNLADWPITYAELEPYYVQAEWEMGISGERIMSPHVAPMSKDYPTPPVPLKASGALMKVGAAKLGWNVVRGPLAVISKPYQGRDACVNCSSCSGFGCHVRARSSSAVAMLPLAEKTGRCEIRVRSYVREISTDASGRVTGVVYFDASRREVRQRARAVILSANATESPRLLLLSKSARFPNGLANSNGIVGHNLMLGNTVSANGLFEHPLNDYKGVVTGAGIVDFVETDPKRGFYGGGRMTARGFDTPINYALRGLSPGTARWGALYKKALAEEANHKMTVTCFVTQLPLSSNRIDLDPDVKDAWGQPAMRLTSTSHPDDIKSMEFFRERSLELLRAAGATKVWASPVSDSRGSAHNRGTCRMGNDPATSVVNKYHRAHDVPNLFIIDGSNLVTGGRNHPTMTIQALAFRAAEHIAKAAKTGQLTRL
jgi:choline dehydrogenase-like flavoprotein